MAPVLVPQLRLRPMPAARRASVQPVAPARYRVQFTASAELRDKLERLRALMRHAVPDGDLAALIDAAVTEKLERMEARRFGRRRALREPFTATDPGGSTARRGPEGPKPGGPGSGSPNPASLASPGAGASRAAPATAPSRHIPAAVRRAVFERDGGRCRHTDETGRRCSAREGLEFHHRHPFAHGGGHQVDNLSLLCRRHNRYVAELDYGPAAIGARRGWTRGQAGTGAASAGSRPDGR